MQQKCPPTTTINSAQVEKSWNKPTYGRPNKTLLTVIWLGRQQSSIPHKVYYICKYIIKDASTYALYALITGSPGMSIYHMFHSKASAAPSYEKDKTLVADWSLQLPL